MKNLFGESFLARKSRKMIRYHLWLALSVSLLLGACASTHAGAAAGTGAGPGDPGENEVHSRVRDPAKRDSEGVQVFPLQNPAVKELLADAGTAESNGDYGQAASLLERALRIQPRDPEILQTLGRSPDADQGLRAGLEFCHAILRPGPPGGRDLQPQLAYDQRLS